MTKCRHCINESMIEHEGSSLCTTHAIERGMKKCPQCSKQYIPTLGKRDPNDDRCIQDIYPNSTPTEREQLMTGICSDDCWDMRMKY